MQRQRGPWGCRWITGLSCELRGIVLKNRHYFSETLGKLLPVSEPFPGDLAAVWVCGSPSSAWWG